jgi:hypothetical protein
MWLALSTLALALGQVGCRGCSDTPEPAALLADAAPAPPLAKTDIRPPQEFAGDSLWQRAMGEEGDEIDLAALADRESATGLLEALEHGGKLGRTALVALPFAADAPVAYRRLAQLSLLTKGPTQLDILRSIYDIAERPPRLGEPIDEGGREDCAQALLRIATDESAPSSNRALAVSALRLPPFAGLVQPTQVPSTFDTQISASAAPSASSVQPAGSP